MSMFVYHKSFKDIFPVGFLSSNYLRKYGDDVVNYFPYMDFHFFFLSFQHFFSQKNWNERSLPVMFCRVHGFISNIHYDITNKYLGYIDFTFKNRFCFLSNFLMNLNPASKKITRQNFDSYRFFFNRNSYSSFFFFTLKPFFSSFYDYFHFKRELLINGLSIYSSRIRPFFWKTHRFQSFDKGNFYLFDSFISAFNSVLYNISPKLPHLTFVLASSYGKGSSFFLSHFNSSFLFSPKRFFEMLELRKRGMFRYFYLFSSLRYSFFSYSFFILFFKTFYLYFQSFFCYQLSLYISYIYLFKFLIFYKNNFTFPFLFLNLNPKTLMVSNFLKNSNSFSLFFFYLNFFQDVFLKRNIVSSRLIVKSNDILFFFNAASFKYGNYFKLLFFLGRFTKKIKRKSAYIWRPFGYKNFSARTSFMKKFAIKKFFSFFRNKFNYKFFLKGFRFFFFGLLRKNFGLFSLTFFRKVLFFSIQKFFLFFNCLFYKFFQRFFNFFFLKLKSFLIFFSDISFSYLVKNFIINFISYSNKKFIHSPLTLVNFLKPFSIVRYNFLLFSVLFKLFFSTDFFQNAKTFFFSFFISRVFFVLTKFTRTSSLKFSYSHMKSLAYSFPRFLVTFSRKFKNFKFYLHKILLKYRKHYNNKLKLLEFQNNYIHIKSYPSRSYNFLIKRHFSTSKNFNMTVDSVLSKVSSGVIPIFLLYYYLFLHDIYYREYYKLFLYRYPFFFHIDRWNYYFCFSFLFSLWFQFRLKLLQHVYYMDFNIKNLFFFCYIELFKVNCSTIQPNFFFYNKKKQNRLIFSFDDFVLKVNLRHFLVLRYYLDYFRFFKYNQYLKHKIFGSTTTKSICFSIKTFTCLSYNYFKFTERFLNTVDNSIFSFKKFVFFRYFNVYHSASLANSFLVDCQGYRSVMFFFNYLCFFALLLKKRDCSLLVIVYLREYISKYFTYYCYKIYLRSKRYLLNYKTMFNNIEHFSAFLLFSHERREFLMWRFFHLFAVHYPARSWTNDIAINNLFLFDSVNFSQIHAEPLRSFYHKLTLMLLFNYAGTRFFEKFESHIEPTGQFSGLPLHSELPYYGFIFLIRVLTNALIIRFMRIYNLYYYYQILDYFEAFKYHLDFLAWEILHLDDLNAVFFPFLSNVTRANTTTAYSTKFRTFQIASDYFFGLFYSTSGRDFVADMMFTQFLLRDYMFKLLIMCNLLIHPRILFFFFRKLIFTRLVYVSETYIIGFLFFYNAFNPSFQPILNIGIKDSI